MVKKRKNKRKQTKRTFRRWLLLFWALFLGVILSIVVIFLGAAKGLFGPMPDLQQLENPKTNLATQIIASDGFVLGKFFYNENRTPIAYESLPKALVEALIATEDERFYEHSGIDFKGTLRAFAYLGSRGGASTISQQLARQLFVGAHASNTFYRLIQKVKEWVLAVRLESRYTKKEILTMYLNIYDFNYQADGIESAARIYFNKKPHELNILESATLVGMLKNSSLYNPIRRAELTK